MSKFGFSLSLALVCFCSLAVSAQQPPKPSISPDYSHEAYVYEQISSKLTFENDGTGTRDISVRVRVQSEAGVQHFGLLRFPYQASNESLDSPGVRVIKPDGTAVATPADSIQDMAADITQRAPFYSDLREKHVAVKGLGVGDVVEYHSHSHLDKPLAPGQFWTAWTFTREGVVLSETLEISVPRDRPLKIKSPGFTPDVTERDKYRVYSWTTSNAKAEVIDDDTAVTQAARGRLPGPDLRLSSFQSWDEVGKWYGGLQADRVKLGPEIQAKAAELTRQAATDDAKLRAIYKYVSTQYRYIGIAFGIGRYQPHTAAEVLANQYGDCKDKHTLVASLLAAAGIKAYPALINSSQLIDPDVPSPGQFDHVISVVPQGDKFAWLDTTPGVSPFGYLLAPLRDKPALVIADNKPAGLVSTPVDPPFRLSDNIKIEGKLSDTDVLTARFDRTLRGENETLLRGAFRQLPQSQWKDLGQVISFALGFGGTVSDVIADPPEDIDSPLHVSYAYTRADFGGDWANHRILPPIPAMVIALRKNDDEKPKEPIWLGSPHEAHSETRLELPKGYVPELPKGISLQRDFAEYHTSYSFQDGFLIATADLVTKLPVIPVDEFEIYKSFRKAMEDDRYQYIQLSERLSSARPDPLAETVSAIWKLPDSVNPNALKYESEARDSIQRGDHLRAIGDLQSAVASDPKFLRDWLILGAMYDGIGQHERAADAFRSAAAVDPTQPLAYKMLGYLLNSQRKYEEAVKAWQDVIKVTPNDAEGPSNLGVALFRLKRYTEAASAYEAATKLNPQNATLQTALGSSYLRAGDESSATTAFQKALALDPGPGPENDVAYELAEAGENLPLALDYAKKAVHSVEEDSRKVDIAILKTDDLRPTLQLGAFWDTLGWVYFKMGDMASAENYLRAAWSLSLGAVVADHLGQVYEAQKKNSEAIHMYQLALAADSRMEDTRVRLGKLQGDLTRHYLTFPPGEISALRTIKLPRLNTANGSSEIFVLFSSDKIEDVYFLSGSEKMKPTKTMFSASEFKSQFPAGSSAFLLRRGILSCFQITGCSLVVYTPDTVRSIN